MLKKKLLLLLTLMASILVIQAQTSVNSSGGDSQSVTGSLSHSVGLVCFNNIESEVDFSSRIEGVQVPYEYYLNYCPADINQDGLVDILDFLEFNSAFSGNCVCREDIDRNGTVNILDFLELNSAFGEPCPPSP